jgi:hypothetical protein
MSSSRPLFVALSVLVMSVFLGQVACTRKTPQLVPALSVVLNYGIPDLVVLGDSEEQVRKHIEAKPDRAPASQFFEPGAFRINDVWSYGDMGLRLYFLNGRVEMIELQQPFLAKVRGTWVRVFQFERAQGTSWDEVIVKGFGTPKARAAGGQFGAEALFYSWGDITYNSMGPNQVALYKTPEIQAYRLNNFGKLLRLFQQN